MKYQYTLHKTEVVYEGFFKVDRHTVSYDKFSGGQITEVIRESGRKNILSSVIAYDPVLSLFIMVEQFRIGLALRNEHPWVKEIVSGFVDKGETPENAAKRELLEETGCHALSLEPLITFYHSPGGSPSIHHIYTATVDSKEALLHTGIEKEGEDICVHKVSLDNIYEQLIKGKINNATALIAYQHYFLTKKHK